MRLASRLLLSSVAVIMLLTLTVAVILDRRLHERIAKQEVTDLAREARLVASMWTPAVAPPVLAHRTGAALGHRVTLIRRDGVVLGDSQFDSAGLAHLENHAHRPEVVAALEGHVGSSRRISPSRGDQEVYVAVPATPGIARVSETATSADAISNAAVRDVVAAGITAALVALALATLFARAVSRPVIELRDVARAIAEGDLARRPAMAAPGEVGDLADAVRAMAEQLESRLRALHDEDALLAAIIESLGEGVLAVDARMTAVRVNAAARGILDLRDRVPFGVERLPRDRELRAAMNEAIRGVIAEPRETQLNGRTVVVTARPLPGGGAVLAVSDLTRTRRLEAVRRDFVANVSHELRTPLTVIGGFAETLADAPVSDEDRARFASLIVANTRRMQRIVDELLDLSRIESGGWVPRPGTVDIAEIASDVIAASAPTADAQGIVLEAQIPPDTRAVYADRTALRQILGNLVENAVRHTTAGSVTVFARRGDDGWTGIGVRDTGVGIAPEHLPRIFERFYRADAARSRESGGTGLGLSIVKHLVEAHGGRVHAESTVGRGTTITASFPPAPVNSTIGSERDTA